MLNKVMIAGGVGNPKFKKVGKDETPLLEFGVASERWNAKERKSESTWHNVKLWGKSAESLAPFVTAGKKVFIEGELTYETWEKDGKKHSKAVIFCHSCRLLSPREKTANEGGGNDVSDLPF